MKRAGLCSVTFRNLSVAEIIKLTKESGLRCIEWGSDVHVPQANPAYAQAVGKMTEDAGLACPSYGSYFRFGENEDFESYSLAAEKLGAKTIRVWAGSKDAEAWEREEYEAFVERVRRCSDTAAARGQTIAFEYHHSTFNNSATHALRLLEDVGRENVKTYWQPMYWQSATGSEGVENNLRAIRLLRDRIENVHVYHWKGYDRYPLIEGASEWQAYVAEIGAANYYLEFVKDDSVAQLKEDAELLAKKLIV